MSDLLLFYQEPEPDRWFRYDRYPRRAIRRLVRGRPRAGGQRLVFLNLAKGLRRLGVDVRENDFRAASRQPDRLVGIIGKPAVLFERSWTNPILFGASIFAHPLDCPDLFDRYPVRRVLVPGEWMRQMFEPYYGDRVRAWPVGIDADEWRPAETAKSVDVLIYDKIYWQRESYVERLLEPIRRSLAVRGLTFVELRYGCYTPDALKEALARCRAVVTLSRHETQGLAYLEMLSSGAPVFAWDEGGFWQDPEYFPDRVQFGPVTSIPYFDERCGGSFRDLAEFDKGFDPFWSRVRSASFAPREYVLENLTLERAAAAYLDHVRECGG